MPISPRRPTGRHGVVRRLALLLVLAVVAACDISLRDSINEDELIPTTTVDEETSTTEPSTTTTETTAPTTTTEVSTTTAAPTPTLPGGWRLFWSDEFDGVALNPEWRAYHSTYGDGNNELACLTPSNIVLGGGSMSIIARRETRTCPNGSTRQFTSGFLGTRDTGTYFPLHARYEIRARLPHAQGLWPAFWLRHRDGSRVAEVDIMEYFHSQVPGKSTATLHLDGRTNLSKRTVPFELPTRNPGWHIWAVEIEPVGNSVTFTFFLDGKEIHSYTDTQANWAKNVDPAATFDIAVNLAVGGNWVGHPDDQLGYLRDINRCAQSGTPPNCTSTGVLRAEFPEVYEVDYVRVYVK